MSLNSFHIHILPQADLFFIYVTDEKDQGIAANYWKHQLFLWHEVSFFGTLLKTTYLNGFEGVQLNGYQLVSLLGDEQFSSLARWQWSEQAETLLALSPVILDAITDERSVPSFKDHTEKPIQWNVPAMVWEEFAPSFWEQKIFGEKMDKFTEKLFQQSISAYIKNSQLNIEEKIDKLQTGLLTPSELAAYFDKQRWLEWIGKERATPFQVGLRLSEPEADREYWTLEIVLRDQNRLDDIYVFSDHSSLPKAWEPYLSRVQAEETRWVKLFPYLKGVDGILNELTDESAWLFLTEASEKLMALGIDILLPSWWEQLNETNLSLKARVHGTRDRSPSSFVGLQTVLDFDWRLSVNGMELSESEFQTLVADKRKLINFRGHWIKLDEKMVSRLQEMMDKAKQKGLRLQDLFAQLPNSTADPGNEIDADPGIFSRVEIELDSSLKKFVKQLHQVSELPEYQVPLQLQGTLRPYQELGFRWLVFLRSFKFGACLADDMGLGKTIQLIAYLLYVKYVQKEKEPVLIVCPTSVLGNWQKELATFAPSLHVHLHYGPNRAKGEEFAETVKKSDIVLTTYGHSHADLKELQLIHWSTIALDEAQNIKNADTKQSQAIRSLTGGHHIALTGTPMENRLSELWAIFDFTNRGYLGSYTNFQKQFIVPIEKNESAQKIKQLQQMIQPFLLRRTKSDPAIRLNLPRKLEQKEYSKLTTEQAALYEELIQDTFNKIDALPVFERKGLILQMLNKLKQLCNHPALYLKEESPHNIVKRSNKLIALLRIADSITAANEACLIFTQYIGMGELIKSALEQRFQVTVPFLNGSVPKAARDTFIQRFQNGEYPFFILSLKAGGTGLNLTAANHVIHYDRWWNPAVENQATDRAYRIGQTRFVHVHKFITSGTLEEKIDDMLEKKQALNEEIITSGQWITELPTDELKTLLSLTS